MNPSVVTLLWKKRPSKDKMSEFWRVLGEVGLATMSNMVGTNVSTLEFSTPMDLYHALPKIRKIPNVSLYYTKPDYLEDVSDAIENHDYFKAFTLCVALYESYGKTILINQFKAKLSLKPDRIEDLEANSIIIMLYTHGLVDEGVYSQMLSVNKARNDFIHRYFSSHISVQIGNRIQENIPKIMKSLEALRKIYDEIPKN